MEKVIALSGGTIQRGKDFKGFTLMGKFGEMCLQVKAHGINALSPLRLDGEPMAALKFLALLTDTVIYQPKPGYWVETIEESEN